MIGHNACALATFNPCECLDEISRYLLQNLQSQPLLGTPKAFHGIDLVWVVVATFKRSSAGLRGCQRSCILNI